MLSRSEYCRRELEGGDHSVEGRLQLEVHFEPSACIEFDSYAVFDMPEQSKYTERLCI